MRITMMSAAFGMAAALCAPMAAAQDWTPPGPIQLYIAFAAGGGADTQTRLIAEELEARHGWEIIPEQATGQGGLVAAQTLLDQPNDGTAIAMIVTETLGYNAAAAGAPFGPADFTGVTTTAGFQMGVVALTSSGWTSYDDVLAAAQGGQEIRFGVMSPRLADLAFLLGEASGVEFNIVEYRGGRAVMDAVTAGDVDIGFGAGIQNRGIAAGDLVQLVSAQPERLAISPDAPTLEELGVGFNAAGYFVIVGPAGMPDEARDAIAAAIAEIVADPSTGAGEFIGRAFGGPSVIAGDALSTLLDEGYQEAGALLEAASGE